MTRDLPFDLASLHAAYAGGLDPAAVVDEAFRRVEAAADPGIFLCLVNRAAARAEAAALGPFDPVAKPLWGVPFAVKDNIDAAGLPTTAACPAFAYTPAADAFVVAALRRAGAILIGKTNLDQFATGLVGVRSPYPPPRHPLDPALVPGGSSSGSAVAVARGIVTFALGTDTAGSGRVPAGLNGIVGLKPTLGTVSNTGVVPACRTLDTVSIFALTVEDAYAAFHAAAAADGDDPYARAFPRPAAPAAAPPRFRVGVPDPATRPFFGDADQEASFAATLDTLAAMGGQVQEIDFTPFFQVAELLYDGIWVAERYTVVEDILARDPGALHPVTRHIIEAAEKFSAADAFRGFYRLQDLRRRAAPLVAGVDLLCVPTVPTFFTLADLDADPMGPNARLGTYTNFVNLMDLCGLAVPVAPRRDGLPGGVTLLAPAGGDGRLAALGAALQRAAGGALGATDWVLPAAAAARPGADGGEIALAVVGAHMSGLPLNHQLTDLGGRFLYAARTAPGYRLFSLPGGPPHRPGLLRATGGTAIDLEVWALPAPRFGDFMRQVPKPLAIGTLTLEDGEDVKGFLCESWATDGALDITQLGGWRAHLQSLPPAADRTKEFDHAPT
ncbi:MAG: allophanate hydrolase [Hyphomicrobiales bacterium]|nr:allophanate hydrolase [Hyphomicrobiales bacterium]MCP5370817.1 allophanate hydrolase [Hyphomicrobiales bacterium]